METEQERNRNDGNRLLARVCNDGTKGNGFR